MMHLLRRVRSTAWAALRLELTLYLALGRWVLRRPDVPSGTTPIGYSRLVAPCSGCGSSGPPPRWSSSTSC